MLINLIDNGNTLHSELFCRRLSERMQIEHGPGGLEIRLSADSSIEKEDRYEILPIENGFEIRAGGNLGLFHGIGKFLHTSIWNEDSFIPKPPKGLQIPDCSFRAIYFSVHFYNWYHTATMEELEDYLEDMVLWGFNAIHCIVPVINIDTIGDENFRIGVMKARRLYLLARKLGMKTSFGVNVNQGIGTSPHEFDADQSLFPWRAGRNLCPSKPGAVEHLKTVWEAMLAEFSDIGLDFIQTWPYDEGGCSCEKCRPWGSNGYADLCTVFYKEAVRMYPNAKFIIGTWGFEETKGGKNEFADFYSRLGTDLSWADYIMVDSHTEYPEYVRTHEAIKPVVNFPEISMWALYPWGGFGANPLPTRFESIERSAKHIIGGGMPYSEGIYEDISKIQWAGYYWDIERSWRDILGEYINYEFSADATEKVLDVLELIERNHIAGDSGAPIDLGAAHRARELAIEVDASLPERAKASLRWRIILIRTLLDCKRYDFYCARGMEGPADRWTLRMRSGKFLEQDAEAQKLMEELCRHYHCVDYNGSNRWTHPPIKGGDPSDTLKTPIK